LLAIAATNNFTGEKFDLEIVKTIKQRRPTLRILLDAAAFVPSAPLDLSSVEGC
jgi:selenocysteine lyase/cysteine desulfurase